MITIATTMFMVLSFLTTMHCILLSGFIAQEYPIGKYMYFRDLSIFFKETETLDLRLPFIQILLFSLGGSYGVTLVVALPFLLQLWEVVRTFEWFYFINAR